MKTSDEDIYEQKKIFILTKKQFPEVISDKIDTVNFLESSVHIVEIIDKISKIFAPVKYDMQKNIEKINDCYLRDKEKNTSLLDMIQSELHDDQKSTAESLLWLTRALLFTELVFHPILMSLENNQTIDIRKVLASAYEGSVKKFHNWINQQLFAFISKMCPTLNQISETLGIQGEDRDVVLKHMKAIIESLRMVRIKIEDFYKMQNIKF